MTGTAEHRPPPPDRNRQASQQHRQNHPEHRPHDHRTPRDDPTPNSNPPLRAGPPPARPPDHHNPRSHAAQAPGDRPPPARPQRPTAPELGPNDQRPPATSRGHHVHRHAPTPRRRRGRVPHTRAPDPHKLHPERAAYPAPRTPNLDASTMPRRGYVLSPTGGCEEPGVTLPLETTRPAQARDGTGRHPTATYPSHPHPHPQPKPAGQRRQRQPKPSRNHHQPPTPNTGPTHPRGGVAPDLGRSRGPRAKVRTSPRRRDWPGGRCYCRVHRIFGEPITVAKSRKPVFTGLIARVKQESARCNRGGSLRWTLRTGPQEPRPGRVNDDVPLPPDTPPAR